MATKHGVSSSTYERIVMGPGAVYIDDVLLGATKGGNVLEINRTFRDIRPDGSYGKVKNYRYVESVEAILTVNLIEIKEATVNYALAGSSLSSSVITANSMTAPTYLNTVQLVAEIKGVTAASEKKSVEIELINCLIEGPFTLTLPETGEAVVQIKFHGHANATQLHVEPWTITFTHAT